MNADIDIAGPVGRIVMGVAVAVTVSVVIGTFAMMVGHESRISVMESNRFTDADAAALESRLLDQLPPQWLLQRLDAIDSRLERMEDRLANIGGGG